MPNVPMRLMELNLPIRDRPLRHHLTILQL